MSMVYNDISHGTFKLWVEEVRRDFISKNIFSMTPKELNEIGYECKIDGRSFMETVKGNTDEQVYKLVSYLPYFETSFRLAN